MDLTPIKLANCRTIKNGSVYNVVDGNIFELGQFKPQSIKYNAEQRCIFVEKSLYNFSTNNAVEMLSDLRNDFYKKFSDSIHLPKPKIHSRFKINLSQQRVMFEYDAYNINPCMMASIFRTCTTKISVRLNKLFIFEEDFILSFSVVSIMITEIAPCFAEIVKSKHTETISTKKYSKNDIKTDIKKIFGI